LKIFIKWSFAVIVQLLTLSTLGWGQQLTGLEREQRQVMLRAVYDDVRKDYYDPKFHGVDWDAKFSEAREKIETVTSKAEGNFQIAGLLETLNDSHTVFIPPQHSVREDYGWHYQMIGERCYVTQVKPGSDAEANGLKVGDEVLTIDGFTPARESFEKMQYVLGVLSPQAELQVELRDSSGKMRRIDVMSKEKKTAAILGQTEMDWWKIRLDQQEALDQARPRYEEFGDQLLIVKLPNFFLNDSTADDLIKKARKHNAVIVDLRGNPGGALSTLERLLAGMFEKDVKIADEVRRRMTVTAIAKGKPGKAFTGKLIVLADSKSASAAELFSRVVQLEKRGTVLGDLTSGMVMAAVYHPHRYGQNPVLLYGVMVSEADMIMSDGKSLEHVGVRPDETILPTKEDLLNHRDPVMARAAEMAGVTLTPEKAGEMFPHEWPQN
jgi:carboxyl-terminal processing protease